ncbi:MAG: hypothetical protein U9O86_05060 [Campylobacterota bacterium]|nr:hypothetical protein [Campylobacterota bacterium]
MKKIALSLVAGIVAPIVLQAGGIGVYVPYSLGIERTGTVYSWEGDNDATIDHTLKNKTGIGIALATNLGKESVFGYKVGIEYTNPEVDSPYATTAADKYAVIQTLEFGVVNTNVVKVWLGPRFDIAYETYDNGYGFSRTGMEFGIAPAVGINVNITDYIAITFDLDYNFAWQGGSASGDIYGTWDTYESYDMSSTGPSARLGVFFKWDEESYY